MRMARKEEYKKREKLPRCHSPSQLRSLKISQLSLFTCVCVCTLIHFQFFRRKKKPSRSHTNVLLVSLKKLELRGKTKCKEIVQKCKTDQPRLGVERKASTNARTNERTNDSLHNQEHPIQFNYTMYEKSTDSECEWRVRRGVDSFMGLPRLGRLFGVKMRTHCILFPDSRSTITRTV